MEHRNSNFEDFEHDPEKYNPEKNDPKKENPNEEDPLQRPLDPLGNPVPNSSDVDEGELNNLGMKTDDDDHEK